MAQLFETGQSLFQQGFYETVLLLFTFIQMPNVIETGSPIYK